MNNNKNDSATTKNQNAVQASTQSRPTSTSRRKALKTALASGAVITAGSVPTKWVAPVVDSVVLPAHAQTSAQTSAVCDSITARSEFEDGIQRSIGIFDSDGNHLDSTCCLSPLELTLGSLPPGTYFVSMGISSGEEIETTLTVTTCTSTCEVTRAIDDGTESGEGEAMVEVTIPSGDCQEVEIDPFP